jgi:hypothetical protein
MSFQLFIKITQMNQNLYKVASKNSYCVYIYVNMLLSCKVYL